MLPLRGKGIQSRIEQISAIRVIMFYETGDRPHCTLTLVLQKILVFKPYPKRFAHRDCYHSSVIAYFSPSFCYGQKVLFGMVAYVCGGRIQGPEDEEDRVTSFCLLFAVQTTLEI